jgi:phage-related tail fiber protein
MIRTSYSSTRNVSAPSQQEVDLVINSLRTDPDFVITVVVNNAYPLVRDRYQMVTGDGSNLGRTKLIAKLKAMRSSGQKKAALWCIAVPLELPQGSALEVAVSSLRSEMQARMSDPSGNTMKMGPVGQPEEPIDWADVPLYTPTGAAAQTAQDVQNEQGGSGAFWNSLPGILTGLGGVIGAVTGNVATTGTNTAPTQPTTSWVRVLVIGTIIIVVVAGVVYAIRAIRKS